MTASTIPPDPAPPDATRPAPIRADLLVVGAGPTGLYAAYCAGFRGLTVAVVDSLPEAGGQISALYPEKLIHDVAGFPAVRGRDLVAGLLHQAGQYRPHLLLGQQADTLTRGPDDRLTVTSHRGIRVEAGAVVVTGGIGRFAPRTLPAAVDFAGSGVEYFVRDPQAHRGRDVVVVGGGDSAVDWAVTLAPLASRTTLVHRRARFRAHQESVRAAVAAGVDVRTDTEVAEIVGKDAVSAVRLVDHGAGSTELIRCGSLIAALGFTADLGPLRDWGLEIVERRIAVDSRMATSVPGVFAAGDISDYSGKVRLMSVGFGEAATAVANAAVLLDPATDLFPGHSTEGGPRPALADPPPLSAGSGPASPLKTKESADGVHDR
ncbi:NAD(P)/FAD-dependent oxidoreductase [Streptomyces sp. NPDC057301]|uniref:NAD(P)/FAD-dependent oxidoreductase n=1 Tax=Streptomyces sp. NPDC057301 TaxID=3346093 RepID=UPI00363C512F